MIAKMISHAPDRSAAFAMLAEGLDATHFIGTRTNIAFLADLLRHPVVLEAGSNPDFDTGLIGRDIASLTGQLPPDSDLLALAFAVTMPDPAARARRIWGQGSVRRHLQISGDVFCRRVSFGAEGQIFIGPVAYWC